MSFNIKEKKTRLLCEDDVIKVVDKHTNDDGALDDDITCILEEVKDVIIVGSKESMENLQVLPRTNWIKCVPGQMPEDDERYKGQKVINVLVTTNKGMVTKVQRIHDSYGYKTDKNNWYWGRIYGGMKAWMPLPEPYKD